MTGAIISHYTFISELGEHSRYFASGSFFFIEPDIAITAYCNLADARNNDRSFHKDDYLYFNSELKHYDSYSLNKEGIQCIRIERKWLKEFPERNITEIHFPHPMSTECFKVSKVKPARGHQITCEGYKFTDYLNIVIEPEEEDFIIIGKHEASRIKLFRQAGLIKFIQTSDCIHTEILNIDKIDVLYTTCFAVMDIIGGPILDYDTNEVIGMISHEGFESTDPQDGMKGVML